MSVMKEEDYLEHYGILRRSGRYPWGSGGTQSQRNKAFLDTIEELRSQGLSDVEICKGFSTPEQKFTTTMLRAAQAMAINEQRQTRINMINRLADKGMSNVAIGERMGINESTVRSLRAAALKDKADSLENTAAMLKRQVEEKGAIDIGTGVERSLPLGDNPAATIGITSTKFNTAVAMLREEGYKVHTVKVPQISGKGDTTIKVLARPDVEWRDLVIDPSKIRLISEETRDRGKTYEPVFQKPIPVSSKRLQVRYKEDGGDQADGVIFVRPGAKDLSLGGSRYAQVRIDVDGTHYLKGMAVLKDDMPPGVDLLFNTNKSNTGNKLDALKSKQEDPESPFGATISRQIKDDKGKVISAMNIVNDEGKWDTWNRSLPSQMLSKQAPSLAKQQLDMTYERRLREFNEISSLTNPTVKKKLLETFADETDSAAVHLQAASIPRQATQVILPVPSMKPTEIFAPNFNNGERVAVVRFPHGGTFEIPELTVNNRNREARALLGSRATDAVGIHHSVAERLSGADFDGDSVLVIPNDRGQIKSSPPLKGLKDFDPRASYPRYEGMRTVDGGVVYKDSQGQLKVDYQGRKPRKINMQQQMGDISNLITDMTIQGANTDELARAVRHSMVVIDCEKHVLDYKASYRDNGIPRLKEKYQGRNPNGTLKGASTIISRAKSKQRVNNRKPRPAAEGGPIDRETGEKRFVETGEFYIKNGRKIFKQTEVKKLAETTDAHSLVSVHGQPIERIYADHSNRLKSLANQARKSSLNVGKIPPSDSAKQVYANEVAELNAALNLAKKNAPLERQAQSLARAVVNQRRASNPDLDAADLKKIENRALAEMRARTGAGKTRIRLTPRQWEAIQAGAISKSKLEDILNNTDIDSVRVLATPRQSRTLTGTQMSRARAMVEQGYTQSDIADQLGVSVTTLKAELNGGG